MKVARTFHFNQCLSEHFADDFQKTNLKKFFSKIKLTELLWVLCDLKMNQGLNMTSMTSMASTEITFLEFASNPSNRSVFEYLDMVLQASYFKIKKSIGSFPYASLDKNKAQPNIHPDERVFQKGHWNGTEMALKRNCAVPFQCHFSAVSVSLLKYSFGRAYPLSSVT